MTDWRFDQGRLEYLQFDSARRIARALVEIDGVAKPTLEKDFLREALAKHVALPFLPATYTVWRNYKRTFGALLLCADVGGRLHVTDVCRALASEDLEVSCDEYLAFFATRFYYKSPVFEGYTNAGRQVFPVLAILKLLAARVATNSKAEVSLSDVVSYLIANDVSGLETVEFYIELKPKKLDGEWRQVRELIIFISQFSFLKWNGSQLMLEPMPKEGAIKLLTGFVPRVEQRNGLPGAEVLALGSGFSMEPLDVEVFTSAHARMEDGFVEGGKSTVTHVRTERSAKLKIAYFEHHKDAPVCRMCAMDTAARYPWTSSVIEIHHLLPLSSPVRVEGNPTMLSDVVGLCPSCHRAVHRYYSKWLKENKVKDFGSYGAAKAVYEQVAKEVVIEVHQ